MLSSRFKTLQYDGASFAYITGGTRSICKPVPQNSGGMTSEDTVRMPATRAKLIEYLMLYNKTKKLSNDCLFSTK